MSIYRFIDSKEIATHLMNTGYAFSMPEAAFLIYHSRRDVEGKVLRLA